VCDKPLLQCLSLHVESTSEADLDEAPRIGARSLDLDSLPALTQLRVMTKQSLQLSPEVLQALLRLTGLQVGAGGGASGACTLPIEGLAAGG
jgi:hypothetical protein